VATSFEIGEEHGSLQLRVLSWMAESLENSLQNSREPWRARDKAIPGLRSTRREELRSQAGIRGGQVNFTHACIILMKEGYRLEEGKGFPGLTSSRLTTTDSL